MLECRTFGQFVVASTGGTSTESSIRRFAAAEGSDINHRLPIWADTDTVVRDFALTGTGLNTYGTSMLLYQTRELDSRSVEARNDYLQLAAEAGFLLVAPAVALLLVVVREVRRRFRERLDGGMEYWLRVGATTGLVAVASLETVEFGL